MANRDRMSTLGRWAALLIGAALTLPGCGDGPICPTDVSVFIGSISNGDTITTDTGPDPGIQIDIPVRTNLKDGERITLTVLDATGTEVANLEATSDSGGDTVFVNVDMPPGLAIVRAGVDAGECGAGFEEIQVNVLAGAGCGLSIREGLLQSEYYAPLPVLNASNDSNGTLPNFQANIDVTASANSNVELFVLDVASATEISAGIVAADDSGQVSFPITLAQGQQIVRATCSPADGGLGVSSSNTAFFVDTESPVCMFATPVEGTTVIPAMDEDGDPNNGTQVTLVGRADVGVNADVEGELASFTFNGTPIDGTALDAGGQSTSVSMATFEVPPNTPPPYGFELSFQAQDRAGNTCSATQVTNYVEDGCSLALVLPAGPVTTDSNNNPADGMQTDLVVTVDPSCAGQTVTTDCGEGMYSAPANGAGDTTMEITLCATAECELTEMCTVRVTNDAGIETSIGTTLIADNRPPVVSLQFVTPPTSCGGAVAPSADVDPAAPGVQIDVRAFSPFATTRWIEMSNGAGMTTVPGGPGGDARITLEPGLNDIVAVAEDDYANQGRTGACSVGLLDIVIGFAPPVNDGLVGSPEGMVNGNQITIDVSGTVSELGATIDVSIDGNPVQAATVVGMNWSLSNVTLDESTPANPFHTIDVSADTGMQLGAASIDVVVDLTPPPPVGGLGALATTRQSIELSWIAPDDNGLAATAYVVKYADTPLSDANFDMVGTVVPTPAPNAPGVTETLLVEQLFAGTDYYVGVAALDTAGNRSSAQIGGPIMPDFDATGGIPAVDPNANDNALGYQVARGDFNGDGFSDIALAAPFKAVDLNSSGTYEANETGIGSVYVYFGSAAGIGNPLDPPDVTISGTVQDGQFGNGLAALEWNGDAATDLAVGAPFSDGFNGRVHVFHGGPGFATYSSPANAQVNISSAGGWFSVGFIGFTLTSARFNSDAIDDLVIAVPGGGGGNGGIAVIYGGHTASTIALTELDPVPSNGAKTLVIRDPDLTTYDVFGQTLVNLGRTEITGDTDDDIGVAYPDGNSVYVIRGRSQPMAAGVTLGNVNLASDIEIQDDSTDMSEVHFGSSMGSIADQNGDGGRELVIGAWAEGNFNGRVRIVNASGSGTQNIAALNPVTITHGVAAARHFGAAVVNNATAETNPDVNNDGLEDLLIVGGVSNTVTLFVWYGGNIPNNPAMAYTSASAAHTITAPIAFDSAITASSGTPMMAIWAGDLNDDGLEDICWADFTANATDGAFEILWDDGV